MRPRKTPTTNSVFELAGGNEDNTLFVEALAIDGQPVMVSVWDLTNEEREAIASNGMVELIVWGTQHPPVGLGVGMSMADRKTAHE